MRSYEGDTAAEIAFPLSGIGTGGVSLSGIGQLIDWEPDGRANKESVNEYTHFALKTERDGTVADARVLQGDLTLSLGGNSLHSAHHAWGYGHGAPRCGLAGLPHCRNTVFSGSFPFARLTFSDPAMPARVTLNAFNPFLPQDEDNSSLPLAYFLFTVENTSDMPGDYTLAFSVGNPFRIDEGGVNVFQRERDVSFLTFSRDTVTPDQRDYGVLSLAVREERVACQAYWYRGGWFDDVTTFWRDFTSPGPLRERVYTDHDRRGQQDCGDMGTLAVTVTLAPGEARTVPFLLAWYYPFFEKYWDGRKQLWRHEYVRRFASVREVISYGFAHLSDLSAGSEAFRDAMEALTVPDCMKEAASDTLCVLKSPTCLRLENGEFWAFEGTAAHRGSCEGTCDHVWQYQYALAYLFPRFARQILETDYLYNLRDSGEMTFRTMLPLGIAKWDFRACVDGQMGSILRFYREWKLSGDDGWLRQWWQTVKKTLSYAWSPENKDLWDPGRTGVITGRQHHTLDVELFGANAWLTGYYIAALKAAAEMADVMGESEDAAAYRTMAKNGQAFVETALFQGQHYIQKIDLTDPTVLEPYAAHDPEVRGYWNEEAGEVKYQLGDGLIIDQNIAQWHADQMGLGDIFDPIHRKIAVRTLHEQNFRSMRDVANPCRIFAVNDEKGILMGAWREDAYKPKIPVPYTEECMTGFEYAAAGRMLREGMVREATEVVSAIRDRYDGKKRNPFAEIECGAFYARSMAAFSLPMLMAGYVCDMRQGELGFQPVIPDRPFTTVWFTANAWGTAVLTDADFLLTVKAGVLPLRVLRLPASSGYHRADADGVCVPIIPSEEGILFPGGITVSASLSLYRR